MILVNESNRFEMKLVGHQFTGRNFDVYDDNWLRVSISVDHPSGSWKSIDSCLLTWEARRLAEWLRTIAVGENFKLEQDFIEPNLRFEVTNGSSQRIRIYFELECRPVWAPYDGAGVMDDLWVEFPVNPRDLLAAADSIEKDLSIYPERPEEAERGH